MVVEKTKGYQGVSVRKENMSHGSAASWILLCTAWAFIKTAHTGQSFVVPTMHSSRMPISTRRSIRNRRITTRSAWKNMETNGSGELRASTSIFRCAASMKLRDGNEENRLDRMRPAMESSDAELPGGIGIERAGGGKGASGVLSSDHYHFLKGEGEADSHANNVDGINRRVSEVDGIDRRVPGGGGVNGGGGGVGGNGQGGGGGGEGGGDKGEGAGNEELEIAAEGRRREKIRQRVDKAVRKGRIPKEYKQAYARLLSSPIMSVLCSNNGWRARLLGDSAFMTKLAIEMITGTVSQVVAEYQKRGKRFSKELEFVLADTLTCLFANYAAIWLSCPTVAVSAAKKGVAKSGGALQHWLASCPSNAFQKVVTEGGVSKSFSLYQRGAALIIPMPKLFAVGFGATLVGYGLVAGLENIQAARSRGEVTEGKAGEVKPAVPVLGSSLAIGTFLAVSTNIRYQVIAGAVEQRMFDAMARPGLSKLGSTFVRSANLYVGSLTIVDWLRFVGLQH